MIWYLAITGIVFSCLTLKFKGLSTGLYITMGWLSVFLFYALWVGGFKQSLWFLLCGGIIYTLGSYFYMQDKKYYHCIWHLFVLTGAILHYFSVYSLLRQKDKNIMIWKKLLIYFTSLSILAYLAYPSFLFFESTKDLSNKF